MIPILNDYQFPPNVWLGHYSERLHVGSRNGSFRDNNLEETRQHNYFCASGRKWNRLTKISCGATRRLSCSGYYKGQSSRKGVGFGYILGWDQ